MTQRSIPFGRKGRLVLPAFREYSEKLHEEIRQAKKIGIGQKLSNCGKKVKRTESDVKATG